MVHNEDNKDLNEYGEEGKILEKKLQMMREWNYKRKKCHMLIM